MIRRRSLVKTVRSDTGGIITDWLKWWTTFEIAQEFIERGREFIERGRGKILEGVALGLLDVSGVGRVRGDSQKTYLSR